MTFKDLTTEVANYLRVKGALHEELVKGFINESILDFLRRYEWRFLKKAEVIFAFLITVTSETVAIFSFS